MTFQTRTLHLIDDKVRALAMAAVVDRVSHINSQSPEVMGTIKEPIGVRA